MILLGSPMKPSPSSKATRDAKAAITADPSLLDREAVGEAIFRARYGDEC